MLFIVSDPETYEY